MMYHSGLRVLKGLLIKSILLVLILLLATSHVKTFILGEALDF